MQRQNYPMVCLFMRFSLTYNCQSYNSNGTESLLKLLEREDWSGLPELPGGKFLQWYASMPENPAQNKSTDDSQLSDSESSSSSPILLGMAEVITFQRVRSAAPSPSVIYIGRRVVSRGPSSRNASSGGYDSTREGRSGIPSGSISPLDLAVDTIVSHMGPSSFPFPLTELSGPSKSSEDAEEHQDN